MLFMIFKRRMKEANNQAYYAYVDDKSEENSSQWYLASFAMFIPKVVYDTTDAIGSMFILFMLHKFSTLPVTQLDPITNQQVPVLSQIQSNATLETVCKDKAYSDKARKQLEKLMDYDETKELF